MLYFMTLLQACTFLISNDEWPKITWTGQVYLKAIFYDTPTSLYLSRRRRAGVCLVRRCGLQWPMIEDNLNRTIPIILPSGKNILADTMFKITIGYTNLGTRRAIFYDTPTTLYLSHLQQPTWVCLVRRCGLQRPMIKDNLKWTDLL